MRRFCSGYKGKEGCISRPNVTTISACHRSNNRSFRQRSRTSIPRWPFEQRDGKVYYLNGHLPVYVHDKSDLATFRLFRTQLVINGNATQAQIARAFGVPPLNCAAPRQLSPTIDSLVAAAAVEYDTVLVFTAAHTLCPSPVIC
jgi:hypothetical protein